MKRKTLAATSLAVYLSLNVEIIDDERGSDLLAYPLLSLAWLLMLPHLLQALFQKITTTACTGLDQLWASVRVGTQTLAVALALIQIGLKSLAWGVGLAQ